MPDKIKLAISACLLGGKVRYDGGHRLDPFLRDTLGRFVEYVPVCPEVECGLDTPREAMHLVDDPSNPRLVTIKTGVDHTDRMHEWGMRRLDELAREDLSGYIFKSRSPSCAMERVSVYGERGNAMNEVGVWARMVMERFPLLPVEDEESLAYQEIRESFIKQVFVWLRWRDLVRDGKTFEGLVRFHDEYRFLVMTHSPRDCRALDALVASGSGRGIEELFGEYLTVFGAALKLRNRT
jgi:uncharacterized protein YbbK (DUF523 family)